MQYAIVQNRLLAAEEETLSNLDTWYGIVQGRMCVPSILVDIEFYDPLFLRYRGMSPADNLLNRPGILCVCRQESRPKIVHDEPGWRDAIRPERPLQCARYCK